jgi:hypothetical protein
MKRYTNSQLEELMKQYAIGKRLRTDLRYNAKAMNWHEQDFVVITNKQGSEGVLLSDFNGAEAVQYGLRKRGANSSGRIEAIICDICATWQSGPRSATITFQKDRGSATFLVCADLACSDHVRDKTEAAIISRAQLREHMTTEDRISRLQQNLARILT